jgi:hypothetical protein
MPSEQDRSLEMLGSVAALLLPPRSLSTGGRFPRLSAYAPCVLVVGGAVLSFGGFTPIMPMNQSEFNFGSPTYRFCGCCEEQEGGS